MKHIKLFENFHNMSDLYHIEKWIESIWDKLNKIEEGKLPIIFQDIEDCCGKEIVEIIDHMYNADKLHYYQNGLAGIDTSEFIENFENIKTDIEKIVDKYNV